MNIYKPTVYELAEHLPIDLKDNFLDLIKFFDNLKLKPHLYASEKMNIKYKGKMILRFDPSRDGNLYIFFTISLPSEVNTLLSKQPDDILDFVSKHLRSCKKCKSVPCSEKIINVLGKKINMCKAELIFQNPTKEQFDYIKRLVYIRMNHIKATVK